jgi:hypothetical protein
VFHVEFYDRSMGPILEDKPPIKCTLVVHNNINKESIEPHVYLSVAAAVLSFVGFLMAAFNAIRNIR